ncbi:MFS transporter [Catellatospora methionotrophica]|uniref:MFS transporter n=1 Tax=Catellatospora methionotrophica TaxID=121620 RepID=A0A8J3LBW1_9ACTN|nr:MFS transporter [Catellatospora methionotrophica]GIG11785.1 MFS transporter [Catellatospora methionotrophica]
MFASMLTPLRAARMATFTYFVLNGFVLGIWVVHIPAIEQHLGITHATLGWLLLLFGGGAFLGMQVAGPLADRHGARRTVPVSGVLISAALILPALATSTWTLAVALLIFGIGNGCLDVSMNAHAVQVEAAYQRPVMSAFHAMFSIGGVFAALLGARTLSWQWSTATVLAAVSATGIAVALLAARSLLPAPHATAAPAPDTRTRGPVPLRIWALAFLAFMLMLSEGVAADWSALAMRDVLDTSTATAAFAYGAFATAMTTGRFLADRVVARFGPVAVVRYGCLVAAAALVLITLSPNVPLTLVGWTLFGIGLSGTIPQLFSTAGHTDPAAAATNMSRVVGLGYVGLLAGPAVIGALTRVMPLNYTFLLPLLFCAVAACTASIVRPEPAPTRPVVAAAR